MENENKPLILWIHGFGGKANNDTVWEMRRMYPQYDFFSIEVDHHAIASMNKINSYIATHNVDIVAGTSLGGFYAMCSDFEGPKFVVNPVTEPVRDLRQFIGENCYKPGRMDGQTNFTFTEEMLNEFREISPKDHRKTVCHYTAHDQLLGTDIQREYKRMFEWGNAKKIDEQILPSHFLTFKYVKTEFGNEIKNIISRTRRLAYYKSELANYAEKGESHDIMDALRLLTDAYVNYCGISMGDRTVVYIAAERWFERLAWQNLPLSEEACTSSLFEMLPKFSSNYIKEKHDKYDICGMKKDEYIQYCHEIIKENDVDEQTAEVLAWGIMDSLYEFARYDIEVPVVLNRKSANCQFCDAERVNITCRVYDHSTSGTYIDIESLKICGSYNGLYKDITKMVEQMIEEYHELLSKETEIRALFPRYREMVEKEPSRYQKTLMFDTAYEELLGNIKILSKEYAVRDLFGLDITTF